MTRESDGYGLLRSESLVVKLLRTGEDPRQRVPQSVPPVLPVVAVARLDVPDVHAGGLEGRHHGPVRHDQWLVDPAAHEEPVGDVRGSRSVPVDELYDRVEGLSSTVIAADVG